jgi:hypothetical protein
MGCNDLQGDLFGQPMSATELAKRLGFDTGSSKPNFAAA